MKWMTVLSISLLMCGGCASSPQWGWNANGQGDSSLAQQKPAKAGLPTPTDALKDRSPNTIAQHISLGQNEIGAWYRDRKSHHLSAAQMHFEEAVRQDPNNVDGHHGLGIVTDLKQEFQLAELHYQKALTFDPNNAKILGDLGYSYLLQNRLGEAEDYLTRAIQIQPDNKNAMKHLGDVYARSGQLKLASATYSQVLDPAAVQAALTENAPETQVAQEEKPSLLDRLTPQKKPKPDATQELVNLIQQERQSRLEAQLVNGVAQKPVNMPVEREQAHHMPVPNEQAWNSQRQMASPYYSEADRLKQELAAIDRERYDQAPTGPIVIDPVRGTHRELAADTQQMYAPQYDPRQAPLTQNQPRPQFQNVPVERGMLGQEQYRGTVSEFAPSQQVPTGNDPRGTRGQVEMYSGNMASRDHYPEIQGQGIPAGGTGVDTPSGRSQQPWEGIVPAVGNNSPSHVEPALNLEPARDRRSVSSVPPLLGTGQEPLAPPQRSPRQDSQPATGDSYSEASRLAARLGMGLPTQTDTIQQTTMRTSPGTGSQWNGYGYTAPTRHLPTDLPPQDLNRAFIPDSSQRMTTPVNSMGQEMPTSGGPVSGVEQFGTQSRYHVPPATHYQYPTGSHSLPSYDVQRSHVDRDLNGAMQAWNSQYLQSQNVTPVSSQIAEPATYGGMTSPTHTEPQAWPRQRVDQGRQQATFTEVNRYRQSDIQHFTEQRGAGYVEPPPYQQNGLNGNSQRQNLTPLEGTTRSMRGQPLPQIVPSQN